jgi:hypothetical protein
MRSLTEKIDALTQSNEQMRQDMAIMRSQTIQKAPVQATVVPTPRSASPALVRQLTQKSQATQKQRTPTEKLIFERAGLQ